MTKRTILSWQPDTLKQTHKSSYSTLIVSGCSFTDCADNTEFPMTWPGYLCLRAGFKQAIDLGSCGAGNEYISMSIVNEVESMSHQELKNCMIIIVWSGIGRLEHLAQVGESGHIDNITFNRSQHASQVFHPGEALRSWKNIIMMQNYLENKKIPFGFSFFVNVFDPPFFPRREASTTEWAKNLHTDKINKLRQCSWVHDHQDSLFEYCLKQDLLCDDLFHPKHYGYLSWTDSVLLPGLTKMKLLEQVDQ